MRRDAKPQAARPPNAAAATSSTTTEETTPTTAAASGQFGKAAPFSLNSLVATALVVLVMGVYLRTIFPSFPGGDSGELMAESCQLGFAHPPGYPLFVMMGHAVCKLWSAGTPAWRLNVMSSALNTIAALSLFQSVCLMFPKSKNREWAAFAAAAMFAFSPLVWEYAVGAEVFSLNNMFVGFLLLSVCCYAVSPTHSTICLGAFVCGLALSNQHTIILFEAPLICWILFVHARFLTWRHFGTYAGLFFLGLVPYLWLPISAQAGLKPGSWGDPSTFSGFFRHFLRSDYGTLRLYAREGHAAVGMIGRTSLFWSDFWQVQAVLPILAVIGMVIAAFFLKGEHYDALAAADAVVAAKKGRTASAKAPTAPWLSGPPYTRPVFKALLFALWFYLLVFHFLSNMPLDEPLLFGVHARFWMQPAMFVWFFWAVAVIWLADKAQEKLAARGRIATLGVQAVVAVLCIGSVAHQINRSFAARDHTDNTHMHSYAQALLQPLPPYSVFITGYDSQWSGCRYLQTCEGVRPDVVLLNAAVLTYDWFASYHGVYRNVTFPGTHLVPANSVAHKRGGFSFKDFIDANIDHVNIFVGGALVNEDDDKTHEVDYVLQRWGLLRKVVPKAMTKDPVARRRYLAEEAAAWKAAQKVSPVLPERERFDGTTWESTIRIDFWRITRVRAEYILDEALSIDPSKPMLDLAFAAAYDLEEFLVNVENPKDIPATAYKNLGLAYARIVQGWQSDVAPAGLPLPRVPGLPENATFAEWKNLASERVLVTWKQYLTSPESKSDSAYMTIQNVVRNLEQVALRAKASQAAQQATV